MLVCDRERTRQHGSTLIDTATLELIGAEEAGELQQSIDCLLACRRYTRESICHACVCSPRGHRIRKERLISSTRLRDIDRIAQKAARILSRQALENSAVRNQEESGEAKASTSCWTGPIIRE